MRLSQVPGNKADHVMLNVKNAEATASIPRGTPVIAVFNGTDDGMAVVLPSTAGSAKSFNFRYGVATTTLAAGQQGEAIAFGYVVYALITRMTRAGTSTSDSWTSSAAIASGVGLGIDTLNNAFLVGASRAGDLVSAADNAVLVDSLSSMSASATATTDTRTAILVGARVFVRML